MSSQVPAGQVRLARMNHQPLLSRIHMPVEAGTTVPMAVWVPEEVPEGPPPEEEDDALEALL